MVGIPLKIRNIMENYQEVPTAVNSGQTLLQGQLNSLTNNYYALSETTQMIKGKLKQIDEFPEIKEEAMLEKTKEPQTIVEVLSDLNSKHKKLTKELNHIFDFLAKTI
jgi:ferritin-like protein